MKNYTKLNEKEAIESAPFNMAMLFYLCLNRIIETKAKCMLENNVYGYYSSLRLIYIHISFMLSDTEQAELNKRFKTISNNLSMSNNINLAVSDSKRRLEDIDILLYQYMKKYNLIFPKIQAPLGVEGQYLKYDL